VIRSFETALVHDAGFIVLGGNLFDSAIMKTSVISEEFRARYLSNPDDPEAFEGPAWCSTGRRTTTPASTIRVSASTRRRCCSCAAPGRSAIRARPKWSTCARRRRS
jgi:hypothetical protein